MLSQPRRRYESASYPLEVPRPDADAAEQARVRQTSLAKPVGSLGRLEALGAWASATQGRCPPEPFDDVRVVVFAGDHGIAELSVSVHPPEATRAMVATIASGGAAVSVLARGERARVRVVDVAVSADTDVTDPDYKVRLASGRLDREDTLSDSEVAQALSVGRSVADEEIDSGADLLIAGDVGVGNSTTAAAVVAAMTSAEPNRAVGRGSGVDDAGWMRKTAAVRDALRRASGSTTDPLALMRILGAADLAALAGFLAQASLRRTPVLLDGLYSGAAALVAEALAPGAARWWTAAHRSSEPALTLALRRLELDPLLELDMRLGEGSGALLALPLLQASVRILAEMSGPQA